MPFYSRAVLRITHLGSCQLLHSKQSILWPAGNDFCSDDGVDDHDFDGYGGDDEQDDDDDDDDDGDGGVDGDNDNDETAREESV